MRTGVVKRIDRAEKILYADIDGATEVPCSYYAGDPQDPYCRTPWPLALAYFDMSSSAPVCLGPVGNRRVLFLDDFTSVVSPNGDTPWTLTMLESGTWTEAAATGLGLGVASFTTAAAVGASFYHKNGQAFVAPSSGTALLATVRFRFSAVATSTFGCGFYTIDAPVSDTVSISEQSGDFLLGTTATAASLSTVEGTVPANDRWFTAEVLWSPGVAAGWVDGNGPAFGTPSNVTSASMTPAIRMTASGASAIYLDWFTVEAVTIPAGVADYANE